MEYGCIGEKLTHSFSKEIHAALFDYDYKIQEIPKDKLDEFMRLKDFKAINVTIPYKQAVIPYLDVVSDTARAIGAVNTIVNRGGRLYGYNTDFAGMTALIRLNGIELRGKSVLVLGSGGTSKTAVAVANALGAASVKRVSRTAKEDCITYEQAYTDYGDCEVIINTTPCGMYPNIIGEPVSLDRFCKVEAVIDAIYNPLRSNLVVKAERRGIKATGGLYMLVAQAVFASEKFTGSNIPKSVTDSVYKEILLDKKNIVLIGMPGCGKTTIGKAVAKETEKEFIDTDDEIVRKTGMSIPEIFQKYGERKFREIESEVIKEVAALQSSVIATGGGAVLNPENVSLLKENGVIVFIDRPLDDLVTTDDRPLSSSRELLEKRYKERYGIYKSSAQAEIKAVKDLKVNISAVKEAFLNEDFGD